MNSRTELIAEKYLRTQTDVFTLHDMERELSHADCVINKRDLEHCLLNSSLVFPLEDNMYITRAGVFSRELFSIRPTVAEYEAGVIVPGDRCLPFVDSDIPPDKLTFLCGNKRLPYKVAEFDSDEAIDKFMLYGEEYAPQYIAADSANAGTNLLGPTFELPNRVRLSGIDISSLKEQYNMKKGDRILCLVQNWDEGIISVFVVNDGGNSFNVGKDGERRLDWYVSLEKLLLEGFEKHGPCACIEDQLAMVFLSNRDVLCIPECGSVEEYLLSYSKKVSIEQFGVETRLWRKGESVPAIGKWNCDNVRRLSENIGLPAGAMLYSLPSEAVDQYLLNLYYKNHNDLDSLNRDMLESLVDSIFPEGYVFHKGERVLALLNLIDRNDILKSKYNWFADQVAGPVRAKTIELFRDVSALLYKVDECDESLNLFPQQELIILTQLYGHIVQILSCCYSDKEIEKDSDAIVASLDGMRWNFEDIEEILLGAIDEHHCRKFKVVR